MDLKNMNMSDLKGKLATVDKKTLIKFGIGFGGIILFLIIYYAILNPMVKERKAKYSDKVLKENEIVQFNNDIISFKKRIKKLKPEFEESSTLFHSKAEVEDLYQSLSKYAAVNEPDNLIIEVEDIYLEIKPIKTTDPHVNNVVPWKPK